jgi:methionine sulfoxide reductase heme-binding subunit
MPVRWRRLFIFLLGLLPFAAITYNTLTEQLGADPAKTIVLFTGEWAIYFLFITLAVTPLRRLVNFNNVHFRWLQTHRRMLGLFTLFYACLHVLAFLVFILGLDFSLFAKESVERPYILVTIPAIILLIVLGITSTQGMMRRLGKNWLRLHQTIYLIALLAWVHVLMQVRSSYFEAALFGIILLALLIPRLYWRLRK